MAESFSREKLIDESKHRKGKVDEKSCVTPAGASTRLTSRINGMATHTHNTQRITNPRTQKYHKTQFYKQYRLRWLFRLHSHIVCM